MTYYQFTLNINSLTNPIVGEQYIEVFPFYEKLKFGKKRVYIDKGSYTNYATGQLDFVGDEYEALKSLSATNSTLQLGIFLGDASFSTGNLQILAQISLDATYDDDAKIVTVDIFSDDATAFFEANKTKDYNILNTIPIVDYSANLEVDIIKFYESAVSYSSVWKSPSQSYTYSTIGGGFTKNLWGREEKTVGFVEKEGLVGTSGWNLITDYSNGTYLIGRDWTYGFSSPQISFPSEFLATDDMFLLSENNSFFNPSLDYTRNNELYVWDYLNSAKIYAIYLFKVSEYYFFAKKSYMGITQISYTRGRIFQEVITDMIANISGDITITTDSNSFTYLDANTDLENLIIASLADVIPSGGAEKSTPALICNLTLEELLLFLYEKMKISYIIEQTSLITAVFRLVHFSQKTTVAGVGNNDLTNKFGINWTESENVYKPVVDEYYYRYKRNGISGGLDFVGNDITIPDYEKSYPITKEYDDVKIFTDINDICQNPGKYNSSSTDQAVLLACNITEPTNVIKSYSNVQNYESVVYDPEFIELRLRNDSGGTTEAIARSNTFTLDNAGDYANLVVNGVGGYAPQMDATYVWFYNTSTTISYGGYRVSDLPDINITTLPLGTYRLEFRTSFSNGTTGTINHYVIIKNDTIYDYQVRSAEGVLTNKVIVNAELSTANLDAGHGKYGFPYYEVNINGSLVTLESNRLLKLKEAEYRFPLLDINTIEETLNFKSDQSSYMECDEIEIDANNDFAKFKGRY